MDHMANVQQIQSNYEVCIFVTPKISVGAHDAVWKCYMIKVQNLFEIPWNTDWIHKDPILMAYRNPHTTG